MAYTPTTAPPTVRIDLSAPLQFVINAASGQHEPATTCLVIEEALRLAGRTSKLWLANSPDQLPLLAQQAAATALAQHTAVVAVGGDGTLNAVAQAATRLGCAMGVVPQGTFNYFARTHGIAIDPVQALQILLTCEPQAVQVGLVNDRAFLVNASLGLYPELLQDREAFKTRFGRHRIVAFVSALVTLLGAHRLLRLRIEDTTGDHIISTPTLFVGNNRLQLEQVGLAQASALDQGCLAAVMLQPIGSLAMLWLLLRGSFGTLGETDRVKSFPFHRMLVKPRLGWNRLRVKLAFDGEVSWMRPPLEFKVSPTPLYLIKPATADGRTGQADPS